MSATPTRAGRWAAGTASLLLLIATSTQAADLATPTATVAAFTPAATPTAIPAVPQQAQMNAPGGHSYDKPEVFKGGLMIGEEGRGASKVSFLRRGSCIFDLGALTAATAASGVPGVHKITCAATGAAVGDFIVPSFRPFDTGVTVYEALSVNDCQVEATDTVSCWLRFGGFFTPGIDPGPLTIKYLLVR